MKEGQRKKHKPRAATPNSVTPVKSALKGASGTTPKVGNVYEDGSTKSKREVGEE